MGDCGVQDTLHCSFSWSSSPIERSSADMLSDIFLPRFASHILRILAVEYSCHDAPRQMSFLFPTFARSVQQASPHVTDRSVAARLLRCESVAAVVKRLLRALGQKGGQLARGHGLQTSPLEALAPRRAMEKLRLAAVAGPSSPFWAAVKRDGPTDGLHHPPPPLPGTQGPVPPWEISADAPSSVEMDKQRKRSPP